MVARIAATGRPAGTASDAGPRPPRPPREPAFDVTSSRPRASSPDRPSLVLVGSPDSLSAIGSVLHDAGAAATVLTAVRPDAVDWPQQAGSVALVHAADAVALRWIDEIRLLAPNAAIVVLAGSPDLRAAARERGADECLPWPGAGAEVLSYAVRLAAHRAALRHVEGIEARYRRLLFDLNEQPMWACDPDTLAVVAANRAASTAYGYDEAALRALGLAGIRAAGDGTAPLPQPGRVMLDVHRTRAGQDRDVELGVQSVPQLDGSVLLLVQARDVTAQRQAIRLLESSERRFRDFFEHTTGFVCMHDFEGTMLSVNPAAAAALGCGMHELVGQPLVALLPPGRAHHAGEYLERVRERGEDSGEMRVQTRDGRQLVWQYRNRIYEDVDGRTFVMAYAHDITAIRAVEEALRLSERRLRTIADTLPLMITYADADGRLLFANESFRQALVPDGREIVGRHMREIVGEEAYGENLPLVERAFNGERVVFQHEAGEGESYVCMEVTLIPELPENGTEVIGVHTMVQDITASKREELRLGRLARIDDLTGLYNRPSFYERLANALVRARDHATAIAVFYLDIDHFKQINDTWGHATGDELLRGFGQRLTDKVRASDVVARMGGDEFTILMENIHDEAQLLAIASQLLAAISRPFDLRESGQVLVIGSSMGVALCRSGALEAADLVAHADALLYESKQAGRGTFRLAEVGRATRMPDRALP